MWKRFAHEMRLLAPATRPLTLTRARASVAALLADSLERHSRTPMVGLVPEALADHYRKESDADAWTAKREFH